MRRVMLGLGTATVLVLGSGNRAQIVVVEVLPSSDTLVVGDTLWIRAIARDSGLSIVRGLQVTWASSRPAVIPVSGNKDSIRVTAGPSLGSAIIRATVENRSDSAWITVVSLSVSPTNASTAVGGTIPFTATVRDASGTGLSRPLSWSSGNPSVVEVTGGGPTAMARGVRGGTTQVVVATGRGARANGTITIIDSTTPSGECSEPRPEWLWCDDFEIDRLAAYFEHDKAGGRFRRDSTAGRNGSYGMRATFLDRGRSAGTLKVAVGRAPSGIHAVDTSKTARRELYWRVFVRHDTAWSPTTGARLIQGTSLVNRRRSQAMAAYVWSGDSRPTRLAADPASGTDAAGNVRTTRYDDFANLRWIGPAYTAAEVLDTTRARQWQCIEAFARLNSPGQADAVFRVWVDTTLQAQRTGFNWVGSYRDFGLNAVAIENILNGPAVAYQERSYDNLIVSTAPIGCAAGSR
jgi:hypothetical protein